MRAVAVLSLVVVAACGPAHAGVDRTADRSVGLGGAGHAQVGVTSSAEAKPVSLAAPIDRVWGALKVVFDSLEIPKNNLDDVQHVIGHTGVKVHRRLGIIPLGRIIECGSTQGTPSAETYDIQIAVLTHLTAGKGSTTDITTQVEAVGRPMQFAGDYSRCSTKGELEKLLVNQVRARLALPGT